MIKTPRAFRRPRWLSPGIGEFWGYPQTRTFAELLIEEDRTLRAVLVGMLREADR